MPVAGLLLTGGQSRRLGRDKASIVLADGRTCAQTVASVLREVADPAFEVGPGKTDLRTIHDDLPGAGPLAALSTGWDALVESGYWGASLLVACDLPFVTVPLLRYLASIPGDDTVIPVVKGEPQYLCARFGPASMERCQQLLGEERRSLKSLVEESTVIWIGRDDWIRVASEESFDDIDTLQDLNNLRRLERLRIGGAKPHQ